MAPIKDPRRIKMMLLDALEKEKTSWKAKMIRDPTDEDAEEGPTQRDQVISWLYELNCKFRFNPHTFMLSTAILDNFLSVVKARPKYLKCIAISCYYLAMKLEEEDEFIPRSQQLIKLSNCGCSVTDVLRMERVILDKLQWNIYFSTALDFFHILHLMIVCGCPRVVEALGEMTPSEHRSALTTSLQQCVISHRLSSFRGSVLAMSLLSLDLSSLIPDWLAMTIMMQHVVKADSESVIQCREAIMRVMMDDDEPLSAIGKQQPQQKLKGSAFGSTYNAARYNNSGNDKKKEGAKIAIRCKVEQIEVDEIYECIKCLYNTNGDGKGGHQDVVMTSAPSTPLS